MTASPQIPFAFDQAEHDITARKHGGNSQSRAAHERVKPAKRLMQERIRVWVAACEFQGATCKEVCRAFGKAMNELSGRFSELAKEQKIFDSKSTRERCTVWVARREWCALWAHERPKP